MRYIFRFYKKTDLDLLALLSLPSVSAVGLIREALRSYVRGLPFSIATPIGAELGSLPSKRSVTVDFGNDDADVIDWLGSICPGFKTTAVRCVIRSFLPQPVPDVFYEKALFGSQPVRKASVAKSASQAMKRIVPKVVGSIEESKSALQPAEELGESLQETVKEEGRQSKDFDLFDILDDMANSF